jgi:transcriptional regulator with XRE-family HTH domain
MAAKFWKDLNHKATPEQQEHTKREARAEFERIGFAALRKAREQTQVELAEKLGIPQASVSALENRTDMHLSTLAKYLRAMGGELRIQAVFPEATFNLEPPAAMGERRATKAKSRVTTVPGNRRSPSRKMASAGRG